MYWEGWVMFFDDFADDLHPTFQKELNQQLFEKGSLGTGIKQFDKHDFQLTVGMEDMQRKIVGDRIYAKIGFITPTSWSFTVDIYWTAKDTSDISNIHKSDVTGKQLEVNWADTFPLDKVLPHLAPYRKDKKEKTGLNFNVEYYYYLLPDITLEFQFLRQLDATNIEAINVFFEDFANNWSKSRKGKEIQYISKIQKNTGKTFFVIADIGLTNSIRVINELLQSFSSLFENLEIDKVAVR